MSLITDLITYLNANTVSFTTIEHAWSMQPFDNPSENAPALFVYPGDESSEPSGLDNCISQRTTKQIGFFYVASHADIDELREEVRSAIQGWQYNVAHEPLEKLSGAVKEIKGQYIWWNDFYTTSTHDRQSP